MGGLTLFEMECGSLVKSYYMPRDFVSFVDGTSDDYQFVYE